MKALILGDVHGYWQDLYTTINRARKTHPDITHIFQLGDFGDQWPGEQPFKYCNPHLQGELLPFHFLDGNHDNHPLLNTGYTHPSPLVHYQSRGSILEIDGLRIMFFGGASSHDKNQRIEGKSWWREEKITYAQVTAALREAGPFDLILSHEHPASVPYSDKRYGDQATYCGLGDRQALQALLEEFHPKFYFFGHHHMPDYGIVEQTNWACAPIIESYEYIVWDGKTTIYSWDNNAN